MYLKHYYLYHHFTVPSPKQGFDVFIILTILACLSWPAFPYGGISTTQHSTLFYSNSYLFFQPLRRQRAICRELKQTMPTTLAIYTDSYHIYWFIWTKPNKIQNGMCLYSEERCFSNELHFKGYKFSPEVSKPQPQTKSQIQPTSCSSK